MRHLTVDTKAATITDAGIFEAIAAAWSVDRTNEAIRPGAFAKTIARWQASGKQIPLHWSHGGAPEDIIGSVDPTSMRETSEGLHVAGRLALDGSEQARSAWRAMKGRCRRAQLRLRHNQGAQAPRWRYRAGRGRFVRGQPHAGASQRGHPSAVHEGHVRGLANDHRQQRARRR